MPHIRPIPVYCSCGRRTTLYWSGNQMVSPDPGWTVTYNERGVYQGWSCGRPGHRQVPLFDVRERAHKHVRLPEITL